MDILELKLVLPHLGKLLYRPRLAEKLSDLSGKRLVLVTAGAGYGKTTLVAQTLTQTLTGPVGRAVVWYRLDRFDRDVATFMGHLAHGLEKVFPGFIRNLPGNLFDTGSVEQTETGLLGFLKALETLADRETIIVLDDYYLLGRSGKDEQELSTRSDVHTCLDFILKRLPAHVRLVLISRLEPPLHLSTLRVRQQILEIHEPDLVFTREEAASFFSQIHSRGLKENELTVLHRQTGGWAAGMVLFAAALKGSADPLLVHRILETGSTRHHIFNFLEENLFQNQSADIQTFMIKTAFMDPMETKICDQVLDIEDSRNRFIQMMEAHLMVFSMSDREIAFHYHHLFRDFLLEKSRQILSASEIHSLHLDIAGCLEAEKNSLALIHYIEAGAYDDAVRLLEAFELEFLIQGKIFFVRTCLEKIPKQVIAGNPRLLFMEAKQYSYFGQPDKSIACLTAACRILRQAGSELHLAKCLVDLGAQYYYTGHIPEARNLVVQVLDTARTEPGVYIPAITFLTFFCAVLGNISEARAYESEARAVIAGFPEFEQAAALAAIDIATIYIHYIRGDFEESMALNLDLLARCEAVGLEAFLPLAYYHAAATDGILGNYQQGVAYAQKGIRAAEKIHLRDSQKGWIYMALSENYLGLGHADAAGSHAQSALDIFRQPGNRWGMANALDLLARISLARKDGMAAYSLITRALDTIAGYGLPMTEAIITLTRARILIADGALKEARTCLVRERRYLKVSPYYLCMSWLLETRCSHALGQKEKAWKQFQKGLAIARKKNLDRLVLSEAGDLVRSMAFYNPHSVFSEYLARLRARPGAARTGLCVQVLGRFRVFVGSREIAASDWTSSKSLILFQYLLLQQSRGFVPKDVLVEMLWQNQDPDKAGKRFNTAMSQLRKILEPDLPARFPSAYVHRKKDCYRLSLGPGGRLDLTEFQVRAKQALEIKKKDPQTAFDLGREAVSLYTGPLLEEVLYEEWCTCLKEEEAVRFCSVCRMLVDLSCDFKDLSSGIVFAEKFLWADPYDEPMYRRLISFFLETGQTGQARKALQACQQRMEELGCPLSPRTRAFYEKISEKSIQNLDAFSIRNVQTAALTLKKGACMFELVFKGNRAYWIWMGSLGLVMAIGGLFYLDQLEHGLMVTGQSRDVSWGFYTAQMTFLVGVAAGGVMLVLPYYLHDYKVFGKITILGEFLAVASLVMCLSYLLIHLGKPMRALNIFIHPTPWSMLFWDGNVLTGYLLLNIIIGWKVLEAEQNGVAPPRWIKPLIYISIPMAVSIHTMTAFIYCGLPGRGFWLTAILAPRFLASAFASGPALLILLCLAIRGLTHFDPGKQAIQSLAIIVAYALVINLFFMICEVFVVFYANIPSHKAHFTYLYAGLHGKTGMVPWMWSSVALMAAASGILLLPILRKNEFTLAAGCVFLFAGTWIDKGMGMISGGFVPSPLHHVTEYSPSLHELAVSAGVTALGLFILTLLYKIAISVKVFNQSGRV